MLFQPEEKTLPPTDPDVERKRKHHEKAIQDLKDREEDEAAQNAGIKLI